MAKTLGSVAVGSSVYLNVGGVRTEFLVVHQGLPGSMYDSSCDGTWLLMKDVYTTMSWNSSKNNSYADSEIHAYLNGDFISQIDAGVLPYVKTVKIPYINGMGTAGSLASGSNGLSTRCFMLSWCEVGWTGTTLSPYTQTDGECLEFFKGTTTTDSKRIAYRNGAASDWWVRLPVKGANDRAFIVKANGYYDYPYSTTGHGVRPALILPDNMGVDDNGNATEPVAASAPHGAMIDDVACPITECYAEVEIVRCPVAYGLTTIDGVTMTIPFAPSAETIEQYPSIVGNLTYTGSAQSPQWADYDSSKMSIGGTQSGTNAGSYTTTFTPLEGYVWPDGSADAYSVTWSIAKAAGSVTLSKTSISIGSGESTTFTVTRSGNGTISVSSSATSKATATLSGTTVTVKGVAIGSATITVSVAEGTNHLAASATCAVTVAQLYTVTIKKYSTYSGNDSYAYFQINNTKYAGTANAVTLSVAGGTKFTAFAKIRNPNTGSYTGTVQVDGKNMPLTNYQLTGTVNSNMTVEVGYLSMPSYGAYAAAVYIKTNQ